MTLEHWAGPLYLLWKGLRWYIRVYAGFRFGCKVCLGMAHCLHPPCAKRGMVWRQMAPWILGMMKEQLDTILVVLLLLLRALLPPSIRVFPAELLVWC